MYSLGRVLGKGGNATVYSAVDGNGRRVAVKVLHDDDPDQAARLAREARSTQRIHHPNVCTTLDAGVLPDGRPFVAMERLEGESLRHLLAREGRLDPEEVVEITAQMLAGLEAAHEQGILHRDIKPENVFLVRENGRLLVKLVDFGVCRRIDRTLDSQTLTLAGFVVGTPGYLSPEQAYGERDLDGRADLFSVGLIMFECLTGRPGFLGRTCSELMDGVSQRVPSVLRYRTVSRALAAIVHEATEPLASKRYASAASMLHALLEARTAMRGEVARPARVANGSADWDVPTQRYVA